MRPTKKPLPISASRQNSLGNGSALLLVALLVIGFFALWWYLKSDQKEEIQKPEETFSLPEEVVDTQKPEIIPEPKEEVTPPKPFPKIPFYVQAPDGLWADPIFQNACEEASILMVVDALAQEKRTVEEQKKALKEMAAWQKETLGTNVDTNVTDTLQTLKEYLEQGNAKATDVTEEGLKDLLAKEYVVIVPADGRKLGNPNFQPPGPKTHMLVVYGYDEATNEFITHDPGTRHGEGYRYKPRVLLEAIGEYPTGNHLKTSGVLPKKGIVVTQESEFRSE